MATPTSDEIGALIGEIHNLKNALDETSIDREEIARRYDEALKGLLGAGGEFDATAWQALSPADQAARAATLVRLKQIFENAVAAEPVVRIAPKSFMYKKEASNGAILVLTALAFFGLLGDLWFIRSNWTKATTGIMEHGWTSSKATPSPAPNAGTPTPAVTTPNTQANATATPRSETATTNPTATTSTSDRNPQEKLIKPTEGDVLYMVMLLGALGGFLRLASSLANYIGNRQLLKSWIIYYFLTPIQGAALAPVVYLLLRVGVLNPATTAGSPGPADSLNLMGIYAFAALTGLFSKQAIEMLADVFSTIFKKAETKDALDKAKVDNPKPKPPTNAS